MARREYRWDFDDPDLIGSHSRTKHAVISDYVRRYLTETTKHIARERIRLNIVDGFAGGGVYVMGKDRQRYYGSPIHLVEALLDMERKLQAPRRKPFILDWSLHLVDESSAAITCLRRVLETRGYGGLVGTRIHLHERAFEDAFPTLLARLKNVGRTIFILDQCGYTAVPLSILSRIFSVMEKPEVIMTFAFEYLVSFVREFGTLNNALTRLGVSPVPRDEYDVALSSRNGLEFLVQRRLHGAFLSAAKYFTPFFITSRDDVETGRGGSNLAFWLVHLSQHHHARSVMQGLHWEKQNHFVHFGGPGHHMLGFDPTRDEADRTPFLFDLSARSLTVDAIAARVAANLHNNHPDGITFLNYFAQPSVSNDSPADMEIYREALAVAAAQRLIEIRTRNGGEKRRLVSVGPHDVLLVPPTATLFTIPRPTLVMPERMRRSPPLISPPSAPRPPEVPSPLKP